MFLVVCLNNWEIIEAFTDLKEAYVYCAELICSNDFKFDYAVVPEYWLYANMYLLYR